MQVADAAAGPDGRLVAASLGFARGGGRTFLCRQHVPYPFHITRPHFLDACRPACATLILQSAAGGLYRGDRLAFDLAAGPDALAVVRSQAATVVHAAAGTGIVLDTRLSLKAGALLALVTEPYVLFSGARLAVSTTVALASEATAIVAEGFAMHDPAGEDRPFGRLSTRCSITGSDGTPLVNETSAVDGLSLLGRSPPLGPYRAMGTVMLLGGAASLVNPAEVEDRLDRLGVLGGATPLPNGAGLCVRLLAHGGGPLARGLEAVVAAGLTAVFGTAPARRIL